MAVWILALGGLAVWSVGSGAPTVPEQRDIAQAVPELEKTAAVVFAAADGPGRVVVLGDLAIAEGCRITAVRDGAVAVRDITVHVRAGEARDALESIASGLPAAYAADVVAGRGGTRFSLHADAGNFIGIDADSDSAAEAVQVRVSSGCRPLAAEEVAPADPSPGPAPAALSSVLTLLGAADAVAEDAEVTAVGCPAGGVAGTYTVEDVAAPADLAGRLPGDMRDGPEVWAFRTGNDSVVVTREGARLQVSASTSC